MTRYEFPLPPPPKLSEAKRKLLRNRMTELDEQDRKRQERARIAYELMVWCSARKAQLILTGETLTPDQVIAEINAKARSLGGNGSGNRELFDIWQKIAPFQAD